MKLQKPDLDFTDSKNETKSNTAQFIKAGDKRPATSNKLTPSTFRLPEAMTDELSNEAERVGQTKTMLLRAAWIAYMKLDEDSKNRALLESFKL